MKYVSPHIYKGHIKLAMLCYFVWLMGCSHQSIQQGILKGLESDGQQAILLDSTQFIPKQAYDNRGRKIVYKPQANPYLKDRNSIAQDSILLFINGRRALKSGQLDLAKNILRKLTVQAPSLAGPWILLGQIAEQQNNLQRAIVCYKTAIKINVNNVNAYIGLAWVQRKMGRFKAAQNTYVYALRLWWDFPEAHLNLAILYDLYLNQPILAQKHMESYQFLTQYEDDKVKKWLANLKQRTGIQASFIDIPPAKLALVVTTKDQKSNNQ